MRKTAKFLFISLILIFVTHSELFSQNIPKPKSKKNAQEIAAAHESSLVKVITVVKWSNNLVEQYVGSGFFVSNDGYFVSSAHVVRQKQETKKVGDKIIKVKEYTRFITIKNDTKRYYADLIGIDAAKDSALLKARGVNQNEIKPVILGDSNEVRVGDTVFAYGAPVTLANTFTHGIVSALHRHVGAYKIEDFIQVDTFINPGNSGGPLINEFNEVVGVVTLTRPETQGIHFASPINLLNIERLKKGDVVMGHLGVKLLLDNFPHSEAISFQDVKFLNEETNIDDVRILITIIELAKNNCAVVLDVLPDSPASKAGIEKGDIIKTFNSKRVTNGRDVVLLMSDIPPQKDFEIEIIKTSGPSLKESVFKIALDPPRETDEKNSDETREDGYF